MSNYRPIANLSFISKLTEQIAKKRLIDNLTSDVILYSTPSNLLIPNSTPPRLHDFPYMTISPSPSLSKKSLAFVFLIYSPSLILSTTPSCFIVYLHDLAFLYNGSLHISHPANLPLSYLHTFLLHPLLPAEFPRIRSRPSFFQSLHHPF